MARPTEADIRRALQDLGLPQIDPNSWFDGTMPEILRVVLTAGPLKPLPTFNFTQTNTFTTLAEAERTFDITGANPGTIRVVKNINIEIITANITTLDVQTFDGTLLSLLWRDFGAPFPIGRYIGSDTTASQAWGALGLHNIIMYPQELTTNPNNVRQLQIRLFSAAAVIKTVRLHMNVTEFDSRLFAGGPW